MEKNQQGTKLAQKGSNRNQQIISKPTTLWTLGKSYFSAKQIKLPTQQLETWENSFNLFSN